jgi:hypothetical protein
MDKSSSIPPLSPHLVQISGTIWVSPAFLENIRYSDNVTVLAVADEDIKKTTFECRIELTTGESVILFSSERGMAWVFRGIYQGHSRMEIPLSYTDFSRCPTVSYTDYQVDHVRLTRR